MANIKLPIFYGMTEEQIRSYIVKYISSFIGIKEGSKAHHKIIDKYNSHKPLARGYKLKYTDPWCAGFVSYVAISLGITSIIPTEVGCGPMIELLKKKDSWQEKDSYIPKPGDIIFFNWKDTGKGDNTNAPDHVGYVKSCDGGIITTIEGNYKDSVTIRKLEVNGKYIRGFGVPKFESLVWGFCDVARDAWYADGVLWAEDKNIVEGISDRLFSPNTDCTRAQIITMLYRLDGEKEPAIKEPFTDVNNSSYYSRAVRWAYDNKIVNGISATLFGPDLDCTRAQIVTILWRYVKKPEVDLDNLPFEDISSGSYYEQAVEWAYSEGITLGVSPTEFSPEKSCTRAEAVTMMKRLYEVL